MRIKTYLEEKLNLTTENRLLKFAITVLGVALIANVFVTWGLLVRTRTIIVPPVVNTKFELSGAKFSDEYIKMMARYIVAIGLNYTPSSARANFEELLGLYDPTTYEEKKREFYELAEIVETTKVTNIFFIHRMSIDESKKQIEIKGVRKQLANEQKIKEGQETYLIEYSNNNGRFSIVRITQQQESK